MAEYTLHDIYHVVFLLRQKLLPELIPPILHYANVFYRQTTYSPGSYLDWEIDIVDVPSPHTLVTTDPIRSPARLLHPVHEIIFNIRSFDGRGVGPRNWEWFTAAVIPREHAESEERNSLDNSQNRPFLIREKEIVRHKRKGVSLKRYVVVWSVHDGEEEERRWVQSLKNGDRIVVRAWTKFPGTVCGGSTAGIVVHMAAVI